MLGKLNNLCTENGQLKNQLRDAENEVIKLKENACSLASFMDQSNKINDLERENRKLKTDVDYLK
jgi:hypothetical protein